MWCFKSFFWRCCVYCWEWWTRYYFLNDVQKILSIPLRTYVRTHLLICERRFSVITVLKFINPPSHPWHVCCACRLVYALSIQIHHKPTDIIDFFRAPPCSCHKYSYSSNINAPGESFIFQTLIRVGSSLNRRATDLNRCNHWFCCCCHRCRRCTIRHLLSSL